ncbi:MAG: hypothetical protein Q9191_002297 [Dirinaria sp. TL-2023a]
MASTPCIACIGVIGKHDNPLHIALFPPHVSNPSAHLNFSLLLNSSLDIFEARAQDKNRVDQDLGCLQHVDERLSIYGWETGTGARFAIIVDLWGKEGKFHETGKETPPKSLKLGDLKPSFIARQECPLTGISRTQAFKALQTAYIRLLQNPFYIPDGQIPMATAGVPEGTAGKITSRQFIKGVERIGNAWRPGLNTV